MSNDLFLNILIKYNKWFMGCFSNRQTKWTPLVNINVLRKLGREVVVVVQHIKTRVGEYLLDIQV